MSDNMKEIEQIKQALANSTPAPWIYQQGGYGKKSIVHQEFNQDLVCGIAENLDGDGYLIANAPTWLSSLITTIESQQNEIDKLKMIHADYRRTALERIAYQEKQIEGYKAITELAVNRFKEIRSNSSDWNWARINSRITDTILEIERLTHAQT